ncbi:MAG: hypothetical protein GY856_01180 [bacterium]|nr:hypothetical protein [bacterium]
MDEPIPVRDLFDVPETVRKGDFVLKLTEGVERAQQTVAEYVVTPALVDAFRRAMQLVGSAVRDGRSQMAYLHGSFGSGKSHFMAILTLAFEGHEAAVGIPELHPVLADNEWLKKNKLLQLRFHMTGSTSFEAAIFSHYLRTLRAHHPEAELPPLFADEPLFENARQHLEALGEERFFAPMNEGAGGGYDWGKRRAARETWNRERFEQAVASTDPEERAELFRALAATHFPAFVDSSQAFVDLDAGLGILSRHAASLGYDAVVLFLDEAILWLASRASDAAWLNNEAPKIGKLVEAQDAHRDVPIISFIARQRDLGELVGEEYLGADQARLRHLLEWWESRIDTIELADRNLTTIIEKRVLRPRDAAARARLDEAFAKMQRTSGASYATLLGDDDSDAFRSLYPFSPVVVEALVALSSSLQRQRTAIKLVTEILVEHVPDLRLGDLVLAGDLFDVLAAGDDAADGLMKARFDDAKTLYRYHFLPLVQQRNGTDHEEACQRLRADHRIRLGCSGCPQARCRADNRLAKTLLIAALVTGVKPLRNLTAKRLVELNHGSLRAPIPGTEASMAVKVLNDWAEKIGQLHLGGQADPTVRVELGTVDVGPIIEQAGEADTAGRRQQVLRDLLYEAMNLEPATDWGRDHVVHWRQTRRKGHVRFGNVRKMGPEQLRAPDDHDWRLIIDYPFDDPGHSPNEDVEVIEAFMAEGPGSWTLVWLPSFLSDDRNRMLGDLVRLEHILETQDSRRRFVRQLSLEQQQRALGALENLRNQKRNLLKDALLQAYGISRPTEQDLDGSRLLERHYWLLKPGATFTAAAGPTLADAVDVLARKLLEARYPRHPGFTHPLTRQRVAKLVGWFAELVDSEDKRLPLDKQAVEEVRGTLAPLGLVHVKEDVVHLREDQVLQQLEQKRLQKAVEEPSVGELRHWLDEGGRMGLQPSASDLVVRLYARWSDRTLVRYDKPYEAADKELPDDVVLEKPDLPGPKQWADALETAGSVLGFTVIYKALNADNLKRFEEQVREKLDPARDACARLPGLVARRLDAFGEGVEADRLRTARSAAALCAQLAGKRSSELVRALAPFVPETSPRAVGSSIKRAGEVCRVLENELIFGVFEQLRDLGDAAAQIRAEVASALRQDELNAWLVEKLESLARAGQELLIVPTPSPDVLIRETFDVRGRQAIVDRLRGLVAAVEELESEELRLHGSVRVEGK